VTHIITLSGLAGSKEQKRIGGTKFARSRLVRPDWITDSVAAGRRQPEARYAVDSNTVSRKTVSCQDHLDAVADPRSGSQTQPTAYAAFSPATAPAKQPVVSRYESSADVPAYVAPSRVALPLPASPAKLKALQPTAEFELHPHQLKLEEAIARQAGAGARTAMIPGRTSGAPAGGAGAKRMGEASPGGRRVKRHATEWEVHRVGKAGGLGLQRSPVRRTKSEGAAVARAGSRPLPECLTLDSSPLEVKVVNLASCGSAEETDDALDEFGMPPSGQRCSHRR